MAKTNFQSVDEYIAACPKQSHGHLKALRVAIKKAAPGVKEKISYQIGAFELDGKNLLGFAGWAKHVSIYPIPSGTEAFNKEASKYAAGKGTLKFSLDQPLPLNFIGKVVKYRIQNLKQSKTTYGK